MKYFIGKYDSKRGDWIAVKTVESLTDALLEYQNTLDAMGRGRLRLIDETGSVIRSVRKWVRRSKKN